MLLLTRLPVGRLPEPIPTLAEAQWAYPFVGLVIGALSWAVLHGGLALGLGPLTAALVMLAVTALVTGGLHHDGLADFADGIGGGRDRAHCLEIMRDSRIGSYGVLALILVVVVAAAALADIAGALTLSAAFLVTVISRFAMLGVLLALVPARGDGLGHGAAAGARMTWLPGVFLVIGLTPFVGWAALPAMGAAALAALFIARLAVRRIGGQTGDVLGAVQTMSEAAGWLALSVMLTR
jgi:adenosylcobinamide-GDP ribazoletransferase